jgi:hypothetical protein
MISKKQLIGFFIALGLLVAFIVVGFRTSEPAAPLSSIDSSTGQIENPAALVDTKNMQEKNQYYTIDASYPQVRSEAITLSFKVFIEDQIAQFKTDTSWVMDTPSAAEGLLTLDISYKAVPSTAVQNYIFTINTYTGGAHGMQFRKTYSYDTEGQLLTFANFFKPTVDGITLIAKLAQKELLKRPSAQVDWITDGAGPQEENYQAVIATDEGLTVLFDPYQVAPWSDGAIDVTIPVSAFRSNANPAIFPL